KFEIGFWVRHFRHRGIKRQVLSSQASRSPAGIPVSGKDNRGNYRSDFRGTLVFRIVDGRDAFKKWCKDLARWTFMPFGGGRIVLRNNLPMLLASRRIPCGAGSNGAKNHRARLELCCN